MKENEIIDALSKCTCTTNVQPYMNLPPRTVVVRVPSAVWSAIRNAAKERSNGTG